MGDRRGPHVRTREPNVSVGIVSALNRIWGKAIQTDAKISPSQLRRAAGRYSGPRAGRARADVAAEHGEVAGVEWYDSGIGFAVPLAHINSVPAKAEGRG